MSPKSNTPDLATLMAQLAALTAENEKLKSKAVSRATALKVSEKGAISIYGLGRFPVTLYKTQMLKLVDMAEEIRQFIKDNDGQLKQAKDANHVQIVPPAKDAAVTKVA